jgi:hypothetical protein
MTMTFQCIVTAEKARAAAFIDRDPEALEPLLHDELEYVHATGVRHNKAQLLRFLDSGPQFLSIEIQKSRIVQLGDGALLTGQLVLDLQRPGEAPATAASWVSQVWLPAPSTEGRWVLRLFHSTRIAA